MDLGIILCFFAAISLAQGQTFIDPNPVIVIEGDRAEVTCSPLLFAALPILSIASPGSDQFQPVSGPGVDEVDNSNISRTFLVPGLTRSDNGSSFQCTISSVPSDAALLLVYYRPLINTTFDGTLTVVEGGDAYFTFSVDAYPEITEFSVARVSEGELPSVTVTEDTVLLSNVMRGHAGMYEFYLRNDGGQSNIVTFEVIVFYPPTITILTDTPVRFIDGDDVTITFSVEAGNPEPTANPTLARVGGGALPPRIEVTDSSVIFTNAMRVHNGTYVLSSSNEHGSDEATFTVLFSAGVAVTTSILSTVLMIATAMLLQ